MTRTSNTKLVIALSKFIISIFQGLLLAGILAKYRRGLLDWSGGEDHVKSEKEEGGRSTPRQGCRLDIGLTSEFGVGWEERCDENFGKNEVQSSPGSTCVLTTCWKT